MDIKQLRLNKGISQLKLAFLAKVSKHRIYLAEQGFIKLSKSELAKINKVIDCNEQEKGS